LKDKHVLVTGHTGFKGSWLVAMLHSQGAKVSGIALDPVEGGMFRTAEIQGLLVHDVRQDIRDREGLIDTFQKISPEVVIHLAAQPLVLTSYENPMETYETNVIGTLNVLEAVQATPSVQATLIITTDKVYRQYEGTKHAFVESDPLGAADPYSTSKAMADLLTQSWIASNSNRKVAIARAGNVIGGGDAGSQRLMPDLINSFVNNKAAVIRNPDAVRPWQHVLDCLAGYLRLAHALINDEVQSGAFNFGPESQASLRVREVADLASNYWGRGARWIEGEASQFSEADHLTLASEKARNLLGWKGVLPVPEAIGWTVSWHKAIEEGSSGLEITLRQITDFLKIKPDSKKSD